MPVPLDMPEKPSSLNEVQPLDSDEFNRIQQDLAEAGCKTLYELFGSKETDPADEIEKKRLAAYAEWQQSIRQQEPEMAAKLRLAGTTLFQSEERRKVYDVSLGGGGASDGKWQRFQQLWDEKLKEQWIGNLSHKKFSIDSLYDDSVNSTYSTGQFSKEEAAYLVYEYLFQHIGDTFNEANTKWAEAEGLRNEAEQNKESIAEQQRTLWQKEEAANKKAEKAEEDWKEAREFAKKAQEERNGANNQRNIAYIAAGIVAVLSVGIWFWSAASVVKWKYVVSQCDARIAATQTETDKKVKDAEQNAANKIAEIEAAANAKVADTKAASDEAYNQQIKKIAEHRQKLDEEHAEKMTAAKKREDKAKTKSDEADKLKVSLQSEKEKQERASAQIEQQTRQIADKEKELADAVRTQQAAKSAAEQSKMNYEDRLKAADVDIAELNNFKENFDTIRNGYWHWAGNNQQIPVLGAAKIIERHGGTLVLEDDGNGSTREKQRFNVLIERLTKEQKALVELLKPNKRQ